MQRGSKLNNKITNGQTAVKNRLFVFFEEEKHKEKKLKIG